MPIIAEFDPSGKKTGTSETNKVIKTEAEWRAQLDPQAYAVARNEGTEPPFTGEYAHSKGDGIYRCVCCGTALFDSRTKFDSGTGWPSYYEPIANENISEIEDRSHGMARTAVVCARCDAHLGHVFPDGPRPTGMRYCMNSAALTFVPRARE